MFTAPHPVRASKLLPLPNLKYSLLLPRQRLTAPFLHSFSHSLVHILIATLPPFPHCLFLFPLRSTNILSPFCHRSLSIGAPLYKTESEGERGVNKINAVQIRWRDYQRGLNSLPFRPWFCIFYGQVARDLLSNWHSPAQAISLSSFRRKPESRLLLTAFWIPACAGMTDQHFFEKGNLDKTKKNSFLAKFLLTRLPLFCMFYIPQSNFW